MSFVVGHKSVSTSVCHDLLSKFVITKVDRVKVIKNLGRTLLDELENMFRSYWAHRLGSRMVCSRYWVTTLEDIIVVSNLQMSNQTRGDLD